MAAEGAAEEAEGRALMAALAAGERAALGRLVVRFGPPIERYAAQMLRNRADAEEIAQEVFLRVWRRAGQFDPARGTVASWVWRIAVNLCIDRRRRAGLRQFLGLEVAPEPADEAPGPEARLDARSALARTRAAIADLPARQRQALLLRALGEMSSAEIGAAMGCGAGAVDQLLSRARARLRAELGGAEEAM
ncbi:hypothetical protein LPB142_05930 [Rhodobacter xanthinilyticus]|uniref:RNA polymerase subunit sigma-70 n=1 Tax=Rhodobacter xanthinilyticus TaxID=1850250 RepID=A0A1D9MAP8_9RHOB|nr:sigma-70 family RNA polymerase sigma factor [Rhodobacter xanthinilyticus]AOZ68913.1 hypothetical protein LPB142_05930 [Rhodobacter xanthinilyticus]